MQHSVKQSKTQQAVLHQYCSNTGASYWPND